MWWQFPSIAALFGLAFLQRQACAGASLERYRFGEWRGFCLLSADPPLTGPARPLHIESGIILLPSPDPVQPPQLHLDGLNGRLSFSQTPGMAVYVAARGQDVAYLLGEQRVVETGDRVFVLQSAPMVSATGGLPNRIEGVRGQSCEGVLASLGLSAGTTLLVFTIHRTALSVSIRQPIFNSPRLKQIAFQTADRFAISTLCGLACLELGAPQDGREAATLLAYGQNALVYKVIPIEGQPGIRIERLEAPHSHPSERRHFAVGTVTAGLSFVESTGLLPADSLLVLMPRVSGRNVEILGLARIITEHLESLTGSDLRPLLRKLSKRHIDAIQVFLLDHAAPLLQPYSFGSGVAFDL